MTYEEKTTWVYLVVSVGVYLTYLALVLSRLADPIEQTPYRALMVGAVVVAVLVSVLVRIGVEVVAPSDAADADARDRDIDRHGTLHSWWFLVAGALAALALAMLESPHFWIANVLYLGFVAQSVASAVIKLLAYRRGF